MLFEDWKLPDVAAGFPTSRNLKSLNNLYNTLLAHPFSKQQII